MPGTRATLESRIADDLDRSDLTTQITAAVTDAIKVYESQRFAFNEAQNITHTFSASTDAVSLANLPVYFTKIDRLRMRYSGAQNLMELTKRDYDWLMDGQDIKATCRPLEYCVYAEAINFDSQPDQAYVAILDGVKRLSTASTNSFSTSSSVSWFTDGASLLRARAKADLYAHVIKDTDEALKMATLEQRELGTLRQKINTRNSGRVRPTEF